MRVLLLALILASLLPDSALADYWTDCAQGNDQDLRIAACTRVLYNDQATRERRSKAFYNRGVAHYKKGDDDSAIADYSGAIELGLDDYLVYRGRGDARSRQGNLREALADFRKGESLVPASNSNARRAIADSIRETEAELSADVSSPAESAASQEPALSRDERRAIQRQLEVLGLYWSSIDGDFKSGTRKAIKEFQSANNLRATGYLDAATILLLKAKATVREEELAAQGKATTGSSASLTYESWSTGTLCLQALRRDRTAWDTDERFAATVREAKRRGLSVADCRVAAGLPREPQQLATQESAAAASSASPTYESWTTGTLCLQALGRDRTAWDTDERFAATVQEAKRRGLSVGDCRVAAGLPREPQQATEAVPTSTAEPPPSSPPPAAPASDFSAVIATLQPIDDVFVVVRPAKVRAAPNVAAKVIAVLAVNDRVDVMGRLPGQDWFLVARDGNPLGFVVMSQLVSEADYAKAQAPATASAGAQTPAEQAAGLPPELAALDYGRYYALVIGNSGYRSLPKLRTAVGDAKAVAALLEQDYGFVVSLVTDGTEKSILGELDKLRRALTPDDNLLIYYAGHGWYDEGAERGYWLPVDAAQDDQSHWISNADITDRLKAMQARHVLVVADSCYSGSLTRGLAIASKDRAYFEDMLKRRARTVLTSGGLEPVLDSGGGDHSVFAKAFLDALRGNDAVIDGEGIYQLVYDQVRLNAEQEPGYDNIRLAGHDGGDFLFVLRKQ